MVKANSKKSLSQEKQAKKEKEIKGNMNKKIQVNILIAIGLMLYFLLLSTLYQTIGQIKVLEIIEILSIVFLFIAIFIMERAYKKDDGRLAIFSIEAIIIAAHTLSIGYVVTKYDFSFSLYITVSSYLFAIYYVF